MNSQLKKIFEIVHSNNDSLIVPIGNITIELQCYWISKLDGKFKIEFRILELGNYQDFQILRENDSLTKYIIEAI